jgi:DNA (cytosine-5)-methyltransferase 1
MQPLRYLSVCSGVAPQTNEWAKRGLEAVAFSEIEPFPSAVLAYHYPLIPNLGDITRFDGKDIVTQYGPIDAILGGTPCQGLSKAKRGRQGFDDPRSKLALKYLELVSAIKPRWVLWENVDGCLSCNQGRDFDTFVRTLDECGYGVAWRVLDARHWGVPQQRRRVFLVGYLGDWRPSTAVLFDSQSLQGDDPQERTTPVACCVTVRGPGSLDDRETYVVDQKGIRHMSPLETERCFGFTDNYTLVPFKGKLPADAPRYKACGNSWAVPVLVWLGERIAMVEEVINGANPA